jgi:mannose-1-phosphate guanylyltransferase
MSENLFALVLAGGGGTRLWPLSRKARPKQFLRLDASGWSLLQNTARRAMQLTGAWERVLVVSQTGQIALVREQLPDLPPANLIVEPAGRNTAAAIGLGGLEILSRQAEAVVAVLPSDHLFHDEKPWFAALDAAIQWAIESDDLVAIGVTPLNPASNYGYLQLGNLLARRGELSIYPVLEYVEKPEASQAQAFIQSQDYLWNTGTFAWKASVFQEALRQTLPATYAGLERIRSEPEKINLIYPTLENISVDYGVMEKAGDVAAVKGEFQRIDVGSLANLTQIWPLDGDQNATDGIFLGRDSRNNLIYTDEGLVGLIGIQDLIVIRHGDVVLVCPKERAAEVKALFNTLNEKGLDDYQ